MPSSSPTSAQSRLPSEPRLRNSGDVEVDGRKIDDQAQEVEEDRPEVEVEVEDGALGLQGGGSPSC